MTGAMLGAGVGSARLSSQVAWEEQHFPAPQGEPSRPNRPEERQAKLSDDLVLANGEVVKYRGKLLKALDLQRLRIEAANDTRLATELKELGVLEGRVNTAGGQIRFTSGFK